MKALSINTKIKLTIITIWELLGKYCKKLDIKPSKTLVLTTPWPRIKRLITVIKDVLLKPLKIFWGFKRFWSFASLYGNIEKKMSKKVKITIDLNAIENVSIA